MKSSGQLSNIVLLVVGVMIVYLVYVVFSVTRYTLTNPPTPRIVNTVQKVEDDFRIEDVCTSDIPLEISTTRSTLLPTTEGIFTAFSGVPITTTNISSLTLLARWGAGADGQYPWGQGQSPINDISLNRKAGIVAIASDIGMEVRRLSDGLVICHGTSEQAIQEIALRDNATQMALKMEGHEVEVWNLETNIVEYRLRGTHNVLSLEFHRLSNILGTVQANYKNNPTLIDLWNADDGSDVSVMEAIGASTLNFGTGRWSRFVGVAGRDTASIYEVGRIQSSVSVKHGKPSASLAFYPNGRHLLVVTLNGFQQWDLDRQSKLWEKELVTSQVRDIEMSPNGAWFATIHYDGYVRLWDSQTGNILRELAGQSEEGTAIEISPDSDFILTSNLDGTVAVWGIPPP